MERPYAEIEVSDEDRAVAIRYAAVIEWSEIDGVYVATVPDIPNLHTHGATREAAATAADAVTALWIAGARETHVSVPPPRYGALAAEESERGRLSDAESLGG